jgi:hypothetical protein
MIYIPIILFIFIAVILIFKNFEKPKNTNTVFDSETKKDYYNIDLSQIVNDEYEFKDDLYDSYLKKFKEGIQRNFVIDYINYELENPQTFRELRKQIIKDNRGTGDYYTAIIYSNNPVINLAFKQNDKFPESIVDLFIKDLRGTNIQNIKSIIEKFTKNIRKDIIDITENQGRYYSSIAYDKLPINKELSTENGIVNIGSTFGKEMAWEYNEFPNALVSGSVGSGKSVWSNYILTQLIEQGEVYMVDFKGVDYSDQKDKFFQYYGYDESIKNVNYKAIIDLMRDYLDDMNQKKKLLADNNVQKYTELPEELRYKPKFLYIEEVPSLSVAINSWVKQEEKEKKYPVEFDDSMKSTNKQVKLPSRYTLPQYDFMENLKQVILQGRALGYQIILVMQRADAEFIPTVVRSQLNLKVILGNPDSTALSMVDINEKEITGLPKSGKGKGYVKTQGSVKYIEVPYYKKINEYAGD